MKSFDRLIMIVLTSVVLIVALFNFMLPQLETGNERLYVVEINRFMAMRNIENETVQNNFILNATSLSDITFIYRNENIDELQQAFTRNHRHYIMRPFFESDELIGYFQFQLSDLQQNSVSNIQIIANGILVLIIALLFTVLIYIRQKIILPFNEISHLPKELSKGKVKTGIPESKSRYFGDFIWGLNMMRDTLLEHKKREMALMKEKKTMILSISHDIKTPLSTIKLGAKALQAGLYPDETKQQEVLTQMANKTVEIENFVAEIIKISKEDLFAFEVKKKEFYLSDVVEKIKTDYREVLDLQKTAFEIADFSNRLLLGDLERLIEVLQNLMENAIKYGDGVKVSMAFDIEEDHQLITIKNTGNMLDQKELVYLFESFWRGSNVKNAPGSGLGLYICRQLMRQMDGDIYARINDDTFCMTIVIPTV